MTHQINLDCISKEAFLKAYPHLYYGTDGKWLVVMTPDKKVCSLALKTFPDAQNLLKRYQKHVMEEKEISIGDIIPCLLVGTSFQHQVWKALLKIPRGNTWSYQELANYIKKPKAVRAVANAVGANPISPLIPCHRVIRSTGEIGGYYWGPLTKINLLKEEGIDITVFKSSFR